MPRAEQPRACAACRRTPGEAEIHFGLTELRVLARDADIAGHREFAAAAEREAVDGGDHRHRQRSITA